MKKYPTDLAGSKYYSIRHNQISLDILGAIDGAIYDNGFSCNTCKFNPVKGDKIWIVTSYKYPPSIFPNKELAVKYITEYLDLYKNEKELVTKALFSGNDLNVFKQLYSIKEVILI